MVEKHTKNGELLLLAGKKERFAFRRKGLEFFALRIKGGSEEIVGHVKLERRFSLRKFRWIGLAECGDVVVKDELQRKGIGSTLLALCIVYSEGLSEIAVNSNDIALLNFLMRRGFVGRWSSSERLVADLFGAWHGVVLPPQVYFDRKQKPAFRVYVSA